MKSAELLLVAVSLSMDAFAAAICKGLSMKRKSIKYAIITGCYFGGFQALMPIIGYLVGSQFEEYIASIAHWIAFVLLSVLGINMIRESRSSCKVSDTSFNFKTMAVLAFATSVDALAVGLTFAFLKVNIIKAVSIIGVTTFIISFGGVRIGNLFGVKFKSGAQIAGGIILIAIGFKILFEHLGLIS